jgi:hypothetical protein
MAYIGKTPVIGNFQKCDSIAVVNGQAAYTLQVGGTNVSPQSENHMLVSLNGILQAPVDSFTVSGSTLTFASNLVTGDVIDFVMILGNVLDLGVPSDNTVSLAKLTATGTKDATTFLRGDNTFAEAGGGITEFDQWRLTANYSTNDGAVPNTNWERVDDATFEKIGTGMSESSGIFSFPSTGKYLVNVQGIVEGQSGNLLSGTVTLQVTENNSSYTTRSEAITAALDDGKAQIYFGTLIDVTNISNIKIRLGISTGTNQIRLLGNTDSSRTAIFFTRLGDT